MKKIFSCMLCGMMVILIAGCDYELVKKQPKETASVSNKADIEKEHKRLLDERKFLAKWAYNVSLKRLHMSLEGWNQEKTTINNAIDRWNSQVNAYYTRYGSAAKGDGLDIFPRL